MVLFVVEVLTTYIVSSWKQSWVRCNFELEIVDRMKFVQPDRAWLMYVCTALHTYCLHEQELSTHSVR